MITEIQNFRNKYPQYNDLDDLTLATRLASKYPDSYNDLPAKVKSPPPSMEGVTGLPTNIPEPEVSKWGQRNPNLYAAKETLKSIIPQTAEEVAKAGGMVVGGIGGGLINPILAPVGAGAGYTAVKSAIEGIKDYAKGDSPPVGDVVKTQLKDFKEGVQMALQGEMLGFPLRGAVKSYSWIKRKIRDIWNPAQKAGQVLEAHTDYGTLYAKNIEEANEIEQIITGLKFTPASKSAGAKEGKLYRSMRLTKEGATKDKELFAANNQAIRDFYQKHFPEKEGIDDVLSSIRGKQEGIIFEKGRVGGTVESETRNLMKSQEPQQAGEKILGELKSKEAGVKGKFNELYKTVEDVNIPAQKLADDIDEIIKPFSKYEDKGNIPPILKTIKDDLGTKPIISLKDLRGARSEVTALISDAKNDIKPNNRLISRYTQLLKSIDDVMESKGAGQEVGQINKAFKKEVVEPYRQGTVAKVLQPGVRGEESRVSDSLIAKQFFTNPDTADDYIRAMSKTKESIQPIIDYASHDLLQNATNPVTREVEQKALARWLFKNKKVLDKFGITNHFNNINKATQALENIRGVEDAFNKSSVSKMLNADPEAAIAKVFTGQSKNTGQTAKELLNMVKDDKSAVKGLKKSFGEYLLKKTEVTDTDLANNPIQSVAKIKNAFREYYPAMRELYKDEPDKIKALLDIQKAYGIMARAGKSQFGGSDTIEKGLDTIARVAAPLITNRLSRLAAVKTAVHELQRHEQKAIDRLLLEAVFDGDIAKDLKILSAPTIIGKAKDGKLIYGKPFNEALKRIDSKLRYLSSYVVNKIIKGEEKVTQPQQLEQQELPPLDTFWSEE